jgi:hypothetical protein
MSSPNTSANVPSTVDTAFRASLYEVTRQKLSRADARRLTNEIAGIVAGLRDPAFAPTIDGNASCASGQLVWDKLSQRDRQRVVRYVFGSGRENKLIEPWRLEEMKYQKAHIDERSERAQRCGSALVVGSFIAAYLTDGTIDPMVFVATCLAGGLAYGIGLLMEGHSYDDRATRAAKRQKELLAAAKETVCAWVAMDPSCSERPTQRAPTQSAQLGRT